MFIKFNIVRNDKIKKWFDLAYFFNISHDCQWTTPWEWWLENITITMVARKTLIHQRWSRKTLMSLIYLLVRLWWYKQRKDTGSSVVTYVYFQKRRMLFKHLDFWLISSPEHEVLMVSYSVQSMSVVRRAPCGVINCFKSLLPLHLWANWLDTWLEASGWLVDKK